MILTKLELDRLSPYVRRDLRDCQSMHRSLMRLYQSERHLAGILYRVHLTPQTAAVYLLSEQAPEGEPAHGMRLIGSRSIDDEISRFATSQCYSFDLLAAPCKKTSEKGAKNSRRRTLRTPEERAAWLNAKGQAGGFRVLWARESGQNEIWGLHAAEFGGEMRLTAIQFCGILQLENPELFRRTYCGGIGPGKAYGLGMLLLSHPSGG